MTHRSLLRLLLLPFVSAAMAATASAQTVRLRPVDQATVRVVSVRGAASALRRGRRTERMRVFGNVRTNHGSGLAISPRLVVTAAHVLPGAEHWAVIPAGAEEAIPAYPHYIDGSHDIAVLEVSEPLAHHLPIDGGERQLSLSERVSVSGYPLDVRESTPAAVTGELSRVGRDGRLQLAMSVNPGHSGGPVVDARGRLIGVLSERGRADRGVEGLAIAVSLDAVRAMLEQAPSEGRHEFTRAEHDVAGALPLMLRLGEDDAPPVSEVASLVRTRVTRAERDTEADAIIAILGWNALLGRLEASTEPTSASALDHLKQDVSALAQRCLDEGPHMRFHYPVLRTIAAQRIEAPARETRGHR